MKWIKKLNELFDTEDLKNQYEIPYLKGELEPSKLLKWDKIKHNIEDSLLKSILRSCPYVAALNYRKSGATLEIGFKNTISYNNNDNVFYYFIVEIIKFKDSYNMNMYASCIGNNQKIYNESLIKGNLTFNKMCDNLNGPVFRQLVDFNNYLERTFKKSHFFIKDRNEIIINPNLN